MATAFDWGIRGLVKGKTPSFGPVGATLCKDTSSTLSAKECGRVRMKHGRWRKRVKK